MRQDGHHHIGLEHIGAHGITALIGPVGTGARILGTTQAYGGMTGTGETRGTIHGTGEVQATTAGATAGTTTRGITITIIIITMTTGAVLGTTMASDTEGTVTTMATEA